MAAALALAAAPLTDAAERRLEETTRYAFNDGKRVVVDVEDHDVDIRAADIDEIRVQVELAISGVGAAKADAWIAAQTPTLTDGPDQLVVTSHPSKTGFLALGHLTARARLRLVVPTGVVCDVTTAGGPIDLRGDFPAADPLRLRSATGPISFAGAAASIDVRTASGDVRLDLLRATGSLFVRTSSASVTLDGGARSAEVDTASGDVRLDLLTGPATVATTTGSIELRWVALGDDDAVSIRSTSGSVSVILPPLADPGGEVTTTGGTIDSDLASVEADGGRSMRLTGTGATIHVETASGDVSIARGDIWDDL